MGNKRILVIGGTRFIGPYVVRELASAGHTVTVFHRGQHRAPLMPAVTEICDPAAAMPIKRLPLKLRDISPDIVIHMIPMGEDDARTAVDLFHGRVERLVMISSCDVYLAYGRFRGTEPGPAVDSPLTEDSPLRSKFLIYRTPSTLPDSYEYDYEKIWMERVALQARDANAVILRLPKVYGHEDNAQLSTVFGAIHYPLWRWTHGYVENVAHAIALAATHPSASGKIYNVGEEKTPTVMERIAYLPPPPPGLTSLEGYDFSFDLNLDTSRIRSELGYMDIQNEREAMCRVVLEASPTSKDG